MMLSTLHYDPLHKVINGGEKTDENLNRKGLGCHLFECMKEWSEEGRIAQIEASTGYEDSYANLLNRCIKTARALTNYGIKSGDVISMCTNNHLNSVVPLIAAYFMGAIMAPTDPCLSVDDTRYLLKMVRPKLIFTTQECEQLIEDSLKNCDMETEIITFGSASEKFKTFKTFMEKEESGEHFEPRPCNDIDDTCLILFSSGTTGLPKGICLTHKLVMNAANGMASTPNSGNIFLGYASPYWISTTMVIATCLALGHKRLLCLSYQPEVMWHVIEKYKVTFLFIAPVHAIRSIQFLCNRAHCLKLMMIGGGPIAPIYLQTLRKALPRARIVINYGQTEIGFISVFNEKNANYLKLQSCGHPVPGLRVRIVDPETEEVLDLKKEGEIRIKPFSRINGYYNRDSSDIWDSEGYIKTGDLGYFDDDLCLFVTDRAKEMFKYMSYHIVPSKLETILASHNEVELAVVIGIPHPVEDNHALGIVTLQANARVTARDLEKYVEQRVDDRNRLRAGVLIMKSEMLPMTPSGKIKRRELKDIILNQRVLA